MIRGSDGNLYGTCSESALNGFGTIFTITASGDFKVLHSFNDPYWLSLDGSYPQGLVQATDGKLYGTAVVGGAYGWGTIFRIDPDGSNFTVIHTFSDLYANNLNTDGIFARAPLVQASDGNFYGTAADGGAYGAGTVYRITPAGLFTTLHNFNNADGYQPQGRLVQASDGSLYGTAYYGGLYDNNEPDGYGTIFKITLGGVFTIVHKFATGEPEGRNPTSSPIQALDGNLYGMVGGPFGGLYKLTLGGAFTSLHTSNVANGSCPVGELILGYDGNLYGGGFRMSTSGACTILHTFSQPDQNNANLDGFDPGPLFQGAGGIFYGETAEGGIYSAGTIYSLNVAGAPTWPAVASLNPSFVAAHGSAFLLTVNGSNFTSDAAVNWNGAPLATTFVSSSQLAAQVPATDIAVSGAATIFVRQNVSTSSVVMFYIAGPVPVLKSISPTSAKAGGPPVSLTASGSGFGTNTTVNWNGIPLSTTFVSTTQLYTTVPSSLIASRGSAIVAVVSPAPGGGTSASKKFSIK